MGGSYVPCRLIYQSKLDPLKVYLKYCNIPVVVGVVVSFFCGEDHDFNGVGPRWYSPH